MSLNPLTIEVETSLGTERMVVAVESVPGVLVKQVRVEWPGSNFVIPPPAAVFLAALLNDELPPTGSSPQSARSSSLVDDIRETVAEIRGGIAELKPLVDLVEQNRKRSVGNQASIHGMGSKILSMSEKVDRCGKACDVNEDRISAAESSVESAKEVEGILEDHRAVHRTDVARLDNLINSLVLRLDRVEEKVTNG